MILSRDRFLIVCSVLLLILLTGGIIIGKNLDTDSKEFIYYQPVPLIKATTSIDLPLPAPSTITTEHNKIRLDLEKISINRFYIVYSIIYGNQSHTAYHLFLTNLNKNKIDQSLVGEIFLETGEGEIIKPVAAEPVIQNFPEDEPLGWKIKIIAKFPYKRQRNAHKLILHYGDQKYMLRDIYY